MAKVHSKNRGTLPDCISTSRARLSSRYGPGHADFLPPAASGGIRLTAVRASRHRGNAARACAENECGPRRAGAWRVCGPMSASARSTACAAHRRRRRCLRRHNCRGLIIKLCICTTRATQGGGALAMRPPNSSARVCGNALSFGTSARLRRPSVSNTIRSAHSPGASEPTWPWSPTVRAASAATLRCGSHARIRLGARLAVRCSCPRSPAKYTCTVGISGSGRGAG